MERNKRLFIYLIAASLLIFISCSSHERDNALDPAVITDMEETEDPFENATLEFTEVNGNSITPSDSISISTSGTNWPVTELKGKLKDVDGSDIESYSCSINESEHANFTLDTSTLIFTITNPFFLEGNNNISVSLSKGDKSGSAYGTLITSM